MRRASIIATVFFLLAPAGPSLAQGSGPRSTPAAVATQFCVSCHNEKTKAGDLVLEGAPLAVRVFVCSGFGVLSAAAVDSRLMDAVKARNVAAQKLLKAGMPVNGPDADGMTALHWAVRQDDEAMVGLLIGAGARDGRRSTSRAACRPPAAAARVAVAAGRRLNRARCARRHWLSCGN